MAKKRKRRSLGSAGRLVDAIRPGCRVTITTPHGNQRTGRAVMKGPAGWVLNLGGRHGTPGIATDDNTVRVTCPKPRAVSERDWGSPAWKRRMQKAGWKLI